MRKALLFLLILSLPTQLGLHFWPNFSFVSGFKIDYLSPTIYLTDLVLVAYLFLSFPSHPGLDPGSILKPLFALAFINTLFATRPLLSFFFWGKLLLYILLFFSLLKTRNLKKLVYPPLLASTIVVISIQIGQLFAQKSLGGIFYYLGERSFNFYTPNIAKLDLGNLGLFIRPYSIFSHPNSLAGFLLLVLVIQKWSKPIKAFISLAVILTFSKIAIFALLLLNIKNIKTLKKIALLALLVGFLPLLVNFTNLKYTPGDPILTRTYMGYSSLKIIKNNLIWGTGLRGFIPSLAKHLNPSQRNLSTLQPIHSLPLLILSELGIFGLTMIYFLFKKTKINGSLLARILLVVALTGAVDHYWWTLPQNQLILILALALGLNNKNAKNK